ncbi:MAG TPA: signal peptidase I [Treponemataceae bacterium]|nr:signal peptidase I [Treponemataceae bacterium]
MPIVLYLCALSSLLFSATCFLPSFEVALFGFPLTFAATVAVFILTRRFIAEPSRKRLSVLRKLLEYLPFILLAGFVFRRSGPSDTAFAYDLVSVLLWVAASALSLVALFRLGDKRVAKLYPQIGEEKRVKKSLGVQALEWVDALLQAACIVLLIDLFLFQLYAIPSESMVPQFMIGDRVVVPKTVSGPKFPLSDVGIPRMRGYDRGDIVVFNNPHYNDTKESRVRSFASQLVYKVTFTLVNINRDEFGVPKADPLVKRICGVPGEKLMLVDGVLYGKRANDTDFAPVDADAQWACWNLNALPLSEKNQVKQFPITDEGFAVMQSVESTRSNVDLAAAASECRELVAKFARLKTARDASTDAPDLVPRERREIVDMFRKNAELTRELLTTNGGIAWFDAFMTSWTKDQTRANLYDRQEMKASLLVKLTLGRLIVRNAELFTSGATADQFNEDAVRKSLGADAENLSLYMFYHDQRNMPEFPKGDEYIPADNYFMMGDNRFNSLDMRHSYEYRLVPIDPKDEYSVLYRSNLSPQYVPITRIIGTANIRFWPIGRAGSVK